MEQHYRWCTRRIARTWWLLRQGETRSDTTLYLFTQGASYARAFGQHALREWHPSRSGSGHSGRARAR